MKRKLTLIKKQGDYHTWWLSSRSTGWSSLNHWSSGEGRPPTVQSNRTVLSSRTSRSCGTWRNIGFACFSSIPPSPGRFLSSGLYCSKVGYVGHLQSMIFKRIKITMIRNEKYLAKKVIPKSRDLSKSFGRNIARVINFAFRDNWNAPRTSFSTARVTHSKSIPEHCVEDNVGLKNHNMLMKISAYFSKEFV